MACGRMSDESLGINAIKMWIKMPNFLFEKTNSKMLSEYYSGLVVLKHFKRSLGLTKPDTQTICIPPDSIQLPLNLVATKAKIGPEQGLLFARYVT